MISSNFERMSCVQVRSYLDSYISGELLIETNHKIQKHLAECRECSIELDSRARLRSHLQRAVRTEIAPAALQTRIRQGIRDRQSSRVFSWSWERAAIAAVLLAVLCLGAWSTVSVFHKERHLRATLRADFNPGLSEQTMRILDIGLGDHIHCAIDNSFSVNYLGFMFRDLEAEYAGLVPLVKDHLGKDFDVAAAHHCFVGEREFAHLILKHRDTMLSLVVTKRNGESFSPDDRVVLTESSEPTLRSGRAQDYGVAGFVTPRHFAFIASNLDAEENAQIAANLAPAMRSFLTRSVATAQL